MQLQRCGWQETLRVAHVLELSLRWLRCRAVDLISGDVSVYPLDLRAELFQNIARLVGNAG